MPKRPVSYILKYYYILYTICYTYECLTGRTTAVHVRDRLERWCGRVTVRVTVWVRPRVGVRTVRNGAPIRVDLTVLQLRVQTLLYSSSSSEGPAMMVEGALRLTRHRLALRVKSLRLFNLITSISLVDTYARNKITQQWWTVEMMIRSTYYVPLLRNLLQQ